MLLLPARDADLPSLGKYASANLHPTLDHTLAIFLHLLSKKHIIIIAESEGLVCPYYQNNNSCELRLNMYFIMALLIIPKS